MALVSSLKLVFGDAENRIITSEERIEELAGEGFLFEACAAQAMAAEALLSLAMFTAVSVRDDLSEIGLAQDLSGDAEAARASYTEAMEIRRDIGDDGGYATLLARMGDLEFFQGNTDEALARLREALRIQMELGDEASQRTTLTSIGVVYDQRGEYSESLVYYQRALEINERLGAPRPIADSLHNIAETYTYMGDYARAQDNYLAALEKRREATHEIGAAYESFSLGRVASPLRRPPPTEKPRPLRR